MLRSNGKWRLVSKHEQTPVVAVLHGGFPAPVSSGPPKGEWIPGGSEKQNSGTKPLFLSREVWILGRGSIGVACIWELKRPSPLFFNKSYRVTEFSAGSAGTEGPKTLINHLFLQWNSKETSVVWTVRQISIMFLPFSAAVCLRVDLACGSVRGSLSGKR